MTLSIFSSKFTEALLNGNKITLSIAGGFALFALLEDRHTSKQQAPQLEFVGPPYIPAANAPMESPKSTTPNPTPAAQRPARRRVKKR
ncbi:hypothetical protein [Acidovorax sp. SDU_ACID1]|uniref:hypothetical protein n=1 Tax=Acidovorax sp. SDU_ACID1 TaxID=3136632 RepID=UPI003873AF6B